MDNCFHFVVIGLINKGYAVPLEWNGMTYKEFKEDIALNPSKYIIGGLMREYVYSFTIAVTGEVKADDIIMHSKGLGIAINQRRYMTVNHLNKIKIFPIIKNDCEIRRIK